MTVAIPVVSWLAVVEVGLRSTTLPRLARLLGVPLDAGGTTVGTPAPQRLVLTAREQRRLRVLAAVVKRWPFGPGPCLRQSLVAGRILRRHGPRLRLGAAPTGDGVLGHAWLEVGGNWVVGQPAGFPVLTSNG